MRILEIGIQKTEKGSDFKENGFKKCRDEIGKILGFGGVKQDFQPPYVFGGDDNDNKNVCIKKLVWCDVEGDWKQTTPSPSPGKTSTMRRLSCLLICSASTRLPATDVVRRPLLRCRFWVPPTPNPKPGFSFTP